MRHKIAGIITREYEGRRELLLVRSRNNGNQWSLPGGQKKSGETEPDTLKRELKKETRMTLVSYAPYAEFSYHSVAKGPSKITAYSAVAAGRPTPSSEIEGVAYVSKDRLKHYPLSTSMTELLPKILADKII